MKAHHTGEAIAALAPHVAVDGFVVSAQNGLNETVIAERIGRARTVGCFVNFGADHMAPGSVLYGAMLFATALTEASIADVLVMAEHRPMLTRLTAPSSRRADRGWRGRGARGPPQIRGFARRART